MEEIWKDIEGYEGSYQVSSLGRVRSLDRPGHPLINRWGARIEVTLKGKILKQHPTGSGYLSVQLGRSCRKHVHRLVAHAFVEGYKEGLEVDHINENKTDNRKENLRWVTKIENNNSPLHVKKISMAHAYIICQYKGDVFIKEYSSITEASRQTGICKSTITLCVSGKFKQAGGFIWKRKK